MALALWVGFFPDKTSIILNTVFPVAVLIVVKSSKGLIRVDTSNNSANPNVGFAFMGPLCALAIRCVFDLHIFSFENVWIYVIGAFLPLVALTFIGSKEFGFKDKAQTSNTILLAVFLFLLCVIDVLMINSNFDRSTPQTYKAEVLDKRISKGNKSTTYYLKLNPWGPQKQIDENTVSSSFYSDVEVGDTVSVNYYKGLLNIPWFDIVK